MIILNNSSTKKVFVFSLTLFLPLQTSFSNKLLQNQRNASDKKVAQS